MKLVKAFLISFIVCFTLMVYGTTAILHAKNTQKKHTEKPKSNNESPVFSYAVMEGTSGKIIESNGEYEKHAPASITKLMVAYVVMEKLGKKEIKLTDQLTISKDAASIGGSQVYLKEGEVFTLEELMKAMMIASANDAAYAIAEHLGGSRDEFVKIMNSRAKSIGMNSTDFHSPHGLPPSKGQEEDISTPSDLLILARELLKYPKIIEWTSKTKDTFRNGKFILKNTNKVLNMVPQADGLKTGYYRKAGFSIVASAKKDDLRLIVVAMGFPTSKERDRFVANKLKEYFSKYRTISIVKKGEIIDKDFYLVDGKYRKMKGVAGNSFVQAILQNKKAEIRTEIVAPDKVTGEIREGQKLGEIIIYLGNKGIGKVDIVSPVYVPKANLFTRLIRRLGLNI